MIDNTKQAFPKSGFAAPPNCDYVETGHDGMTLREVYAGLAMQGLIIGQIRHLESDQFGYRLTPSDLAECAVEQADALIAELNKETSE